MRSLVILMLCLFLVSTTASGQVSVGAGTDCDFDTTTDTEALQTALDAGHDEIRLTFENEYAGVIVIDEGVVLRGGFANCADANSDNQNTVHSVISAQGLDDTVIRIENIQDASVRLEQLAIINGDGSLFGVPGGVAIREMTGEVHLNRLDIRGNTGSRGGGLRIESPFGDDQGALDVVITDTAIRNNTASRGGGMACSIREPDFDLNIFASGGTTVRGNHATVRGGGIWMEGCELDFEAGVASAPLGGNAEFEIFQNTSEASGAGLSLFHEARVTLRGTFAQAFNLNLNEGNLDPSESGAGGGAQVAAGAELEIINGLVDSNSTGRYGGGLFATEGGRITVNRDPAGCIYARYCSHLVGNRVAGQLPGGGGALAVRSGGEIRVSRTLFWLNNADDPGYIAFVDQSAVDDAARLILEGNIILENGQSIEDSNDTAFELKNNSQTSMAYNTLIRNRADRTVFLQLAGSSLEVIGNIIQEFGNIHQSNGTADTAFSCNLMPSLDTVEAPTVDTVIGQAQFIDVGKRDLQLTTSDQVAMDICSDAPYLPGMDLNGQARGVDQPGVDDLNGPYDLGALEFNPAAIDRIFSDAFQQ
ncbi:MAG: hypothetical protein AAGJ52_00875 [Pseudomonadota bacterium]